MPTISDLENAIDSLLAHPLGPSNYSLVKSVPDKAYEAYVFCLCLRAARELGANVILHGISDPPNPFVFRGGPGHIYSDHQNYGYAGFSLNGFEFEIHAGVEFIGSSGMTHEVDVAIIKGEHAERCRRNRLIPSASSLIAAWECKFYDSLLKKELARTFVGLIDDFRSQIRLKGFCSNQEHPQIKDYLAPPNRPFPHLKLSPLQPNNEEIFVKTLSGEIKKLAKA